MENTILKDFIEHNNSLVREWMDNPSDFCERNIYFRRNCTPSGALSMHGMPEPYLGDPLHCSAVIVNINPGGVMKKHNCWCTREESSNFINKYLLSGLYEKFAYEFPYLTLNENERGTKWWESRNKWIKSFCQKEDIRPFAIELCPWHSDRWKGMKYDDELRAYINQYVIKPAGEVIKNSELPFGLAVGKPIVVALEALGFQKKEEWNWETTSLKHWPVNAKGVAIKRCYAFLYNKESNTSFLCTWAQGGNKAPNDKFQNAEKEICEIIKNTFLKVISNN